MNKDELLKLAGSPVGEIIAGAVMFKFRNVENLPKGTKLYTEAQLLAMYAKGEGDMRERAPMEAIGKLLAQAMDQAVANGASSVSMPDEYVEIAAWLCALPITPTNTEGEQG